MENTSIRTLGIKGVEERGRKNNRKRGEIAEMKMELRLEVYVSPGCEFSPLMRLLTWLLYDGSDLISFQNTSITRWPVAFDMGSVINMIAYSSLESRLESQRRERTRPLM